MIIMNKVVVLEIFTSFMQIDFEVNNPDFPWIISHPFTNSCSVMFDNEIINLINNKEKANKWRTQQLKLLYKMDNIVSMFMLVNKPYILVILKYLVQHNCITRKECSEILNSYWVSIEQISMDINVLTCDVLKIFEYADKKYLMSKKEIQRIKELPKKIIVYRGVTEYNRKYKDALSWTLNLDTAKWFAKRFKQKGYVWSVVINKEDILCYFGERATEEEVIININKYKEKIQENEV